MESSWRRRLSDAFWWAAIIAVLVLDAVDPSPLWPWFTSGVLLAIGIWAFWMVDRHQKRDDARTKRMQAEIDKLWQQVDKLRQQVEGEPERQAKAIRDARWEAAKEKHRAEWEQKLRAMTDEERRRILDQGISEAKEEVGRRLAAESREFEQRRLEGLEGSETPD